MAEADASLASNPVTKTAGATRTYQEALKSALDKANNNLNFVQPSASSCDVSYSANEPSCVPAQ